MSTLVRVLLVDDHTLVRTGLRLLLEKEGNVEVVGEAEDADEAVSLAVALKPDIVLMDISLHESDGIGATHRITQLHPETRVIALTMHTEEAYLLKFLDAGGVGFIRKSAVDRDLIQAIHSVMRGEIFLEKEGVQVMARRHYGLPSPVSNHEPGPEVLSDRERQVIELVAKGYTCREIGDQLSLSPRTVETYRERIMSKLSLSHRSELVEFALRHRLLQS